MFGEFRSANFQFLKHEYDEVVTVNSARWQCEGDRNRQKYSTCLQMEVSEQPEKLYMKFNVKSNGQK
jgi:hypothetical protein